MRKGSLEGSLSRRALSPPPQGLAASLSPPAGPPATLPPLVTTARTDPGSARASGQTIRPGLSVLTGVQE
jgi:hypothetical protein